MMYDYDGNYIAIMRWGEMRYEDKSYGIFGKLLIPGGLGDNKKVVIVSLAFVCYICAYIICMVIFVIGI